MKFLLANWIIFRKGLPKSSSSRESHASKQLRDSRHKQLRAIPKGVSRHACCSPTGECDVHFNYLREYPPMTGLPPMLNAKSHPRATGRVSRNVLYLIVLLALLNCVIGESPAFAQNI